jgi:hypothetical protein
MLSRRFWIHVPPVVMLYVSIVRRAYGESATKVRSKSTLSIGQYWPTGGRRLIVIVSTTAREGKAKPPTAAIATKDRKPMLFPLT